MKRLVITCILAAVLALSGQVLAKDVTVTWDASQEANLDHYEVWFAPWLQTQTSGPFKKDADVPVGTIKHTVKDLDDGTFYVFQVYAVNTQGLFSHASNVATDQTLVIPGTVTGVTVNP